MKLVHSAYGKAMPDAVVKIIKDKHDHTYDASQFTSRTIDN